MYIHHIDPVIFAIGPLQVRWYGLAYAVGFIIMYLWLEHLAKHKEIKNLTPERVEALTLWLILGVIIGSRLFEFVFWRPGVWLTDPLEVLRIWHGGMSFHGGIIGVSLAAYLYCRKHKIPLLEVGDAIAIPAAFSLFLGRIANYINAELPGKVTNVPWCVNFNSERDTAGQLVCRHPSQLYEAAKNLIIFGALWLPWQTRKNHPGLVMWSFIGLYGLLRLIVNFWREDPAVLLGLSIGQVLSFIMFVLGGAMVARTLLTSKKV